MTRDNLRKNNLTKENLIKENLIKENLIKERSIVLILAAILLGLLIICFCSVNAAAEEPCLSGRTDAAETEFKAGVKAVLGDFGIRNAGVTLTKVSYDGVNITYQAEIHISAYKSIKGEEKERLVRELNKLTINVENSKVKYSFS